MRLVTFRSGIRRSGGAVTSFGVVTGEHVVDAKAALNHEFGSLREILEQGALGRLAEAVSRRRPDYELRELTLLPPILDPGKIICAGVNYHAHREETSRTVTEHPLLFSRFGDTQIGHGALALKPAVSEKFDYEGELAVIIGSTAEAVTTDEAMNHVAGFACYNDFSVRDWQRHTTQFLPGKNFKGTGAFGPYLVTADEIEDVRKCQLQTWVNGDLRQSAVVADLVFSIEQLISYISTFTVLSPGDVLVTGTPGGVGLYRQPPEFLAAGDRVEVEITGLGRLVNVVQ